MDIARYIAEKSGLDYTVLFMPESGAIKLAYADSTVVIKKWDASVVGFPQLTKKQIATVLATPEPIDQIAVKQVCQNRIYAVATAQKQQNVNFYVTGNPTEENKADFVALAAWIRDMRATCNTIIATGNENYTQDSFWPVVPANALALVARA